MSIHDDDHDLEYSTRILNHRNKCDKKETEEWFSQKENIRRIDQAALFNRTLAPKKFTGLKEQEYVRLQKRIFREQLRPFRWTSVAASILIATSVIFLIFNKQDKTPPATIITEVIMPGKYKAELILDNGTLIRLSQQNQKIRDNGLTCLLNDSVSGLIYTKRDLNDPAEKIRYNTLKVPTGGFYPLTLSDGTKIWLNAASELRYPEAFTGKERAVYLKGEGYFEVKKDTRRPFIVYTEQSHITVLGTSFNINTYNDENKIYATLVEGSVSFVSDKTGQQIILQPGHQITMETVSGKLSVKEVDIEVYTAWKDGMFYFKDMTLEEIMRTISRWYQVKVIYKNTQLKTETYNGKMPMYSGIEDVLKKIELSGGTRFEIKGRTIFISDNKKRDFINPVR